MKIIIVDNEKYRNWTDGFHSARKSFVHYYPGEIFEVIPYRYNEKDYYEVDLDNLDLEQKKLCPDQQGEKVFWIDKSMTEPYYMLPEELFRI